MGSSKKVEITVGAFVLLALIALVYLALNVSNVTGFSAQKGYQISASFDNIGGLSKRAKVTLSGVTVGRVTDIAYDKKTFQAKVSMLINADVDYLPTDTQASIYTSGLLGEQYISLEPGAEDDVIKEGSQLSMTQSAVVLEELIGQFMTNMATK